MAWRVTVEVPGLFVQPLEDTFWEEALAFHVTHVDVGRTPKDLSFAATVPVRDMSRKIAASDEHWLVSLDFDDRGTAHRIRSAIDSFLADKAPQTNQLEEIDLTDWADRLTEARGPVHIAGFEIADAVYTGRIDGTRNRIVLRSGLAFGTGHHATTAGCLEAMADIARTYTVRSVLDVGTGTGILAVGAARLFHCAVVASDIDPVAVAVTRDNVHRNGCAARVRALTADGVRHRHIFERSPYDVICANILAPALIRLAGDLCPLLVPGGHLILSGILDEQARSVAAAYLGRRLVHDERFRLDGWTTLVFRKPPQQDN